MSVAQACGGSAEQGKHTQPSSQVVVPGATGGHPALSGTTGTTEPGGANTGGSVGASGGVGTTMDFGATGGRVNVAGDTAVTGGSGTGGTSALQGAGGSAPTSCPEYAPNPGASCSTGTVCTYPDSHGTCSNPRTTRAQCNDSRWTVEEPTGCAQDLSKSNCAIDGTWELDVSGDGGGVRGIPDETIVTISHDAVGQYYVAQSEESGYTSFNYSSKDCTVQAHYDYDTIIPPANGSTCGLVSTDCELALVFSNGVGNGTLSCTGHPNTCVGVYGGTAVLQVKAVRLQGRT